MADDIQKVIEEILNDLNKLKEDRLRNQIEEQPEIDEEKLRIINKNVDKLRKEEEDLKEQLELQEKENFSLQATINSLQTSLQKKLGELKNSELQLSEIYRGIWTERENFCTKADEINDEFGIMSDWWKTQLKFVSDLENLRKKRASNKKGQKEIEVCRNNLTKINKTINILLNEKKDSEILSRTPKNGDPDITRAENSDEMVASEIKLYPIFKPLKKIKLPESENKIKKSTEADEYANDKFFEMMDVEKVRKINKKKKKI